MNADPTEAINQILSPLAPLFIALLIASLIGTVFFIAYTLRLWKVQSATLQMQKDIADIKHHLTNNAPEQVKVAETKTPDQPTQTTEQPNRYE